MIKGQIILRLKDGSVFNYANRFLKEKTGTDGADPENLLFPGFPGFSYYYTGFGTDKFENQTDPGMIKADFEFLSKQVSAGGTGFIKWPETESAATDSAGAVDILVREVTGLINSGVTFSRRQILLSEVSSINIDEEWVTYPFGKESGYQLPKSSPNFYGFAEGKERTAKGVDKGPDFNKYWTTDNGYIPRPLIKVNADGSYSVLNEKEFTGLVEKKDIKGNISVYGYRDIEKSTGVYRKNSGSALVPAWEFPNVVKYEDLDLVLAKTEANKVYDITVDTTGVDPNEFRGSAKTKTASQSPFGKHLAKSNAILNVTLDLPDTVTDTTLMLYKNAKVKTINITKANNLTIASNMFADCSKMESINTSNFTKIEDATRFISGCKLITNVDTSALANVTNATNMFSGSGIKEVNLSVFSKVTNATGMLSDTEITSVNISGMTALDNSTEMFMNCTSLKDIDWKDIKPTTFDRMFQGATADKVIECYAEEQANFIDTNAVTMGLEKYTNKFNKKRKLTKSFNYAGAPSPVVEELNEGDKIDLSPAVVEGKTFLKWTTDVEGKIDAPTVMPANDLTIYAQWDVKKHKFTKNLNYSGSTPEVIEVAEGEPLDYGLNPSREGYKFTKWANDIDGTDVNVPINMGTSDITVYAQWEVYEGPKRNLKKYLNYEGAPAPEVTQLKAGDPISLKPAQVEGRVFTKWTTDINGTKEVPAIMPDYDLSVYAQWQPGKHKFTKDLNYEGAPAPTVVELDEGDPITYGIPTRVGGTFTKWTNDKNGFDADIPVYMGGDDITLYAQWEELPKDTILYKDLDAHIATLQPGINYIVVDATAAPVGDFTYTTPATNSEIVNKLNKAPQGVMFDLVIIPPADLADVSGCFEGATNINTVKFTSK